MWSSVLVVCGRRSSGCELDQKLARPASVPARPLELGRLNHPPLPVISPFVRLYSLYFVPFSPSVPSPPARDAHRPSYALVLRPSIRTASKRSRLHSSVARPHHSLNSF